MSLNRRVLISAPRDIRLDPRRIKIKQAIIDQIKSAGYEPQIFLTPAGSVGLAAGTGWSLDEVERVARRCVGAALIGLPFWRTTLNRRKVWLPTDYFLFSEDDPLEGTSGGVAPRDNVVFEAGYFMSAKGAERCLIVRHGEAKMPADVGGTIYVPLSKNADVSSIEGRLSDFLSRNLQ